MRIQLGSGSPLSCRSASQLPGAHFSLHPDHVGRGCAAERVSLLPSAQFSPTEHQEISPTIAGSLCGVRCISMLPGRALSSIRPSKDAFLAADLRAVLQTEPHCCASLLPGAQAKLALLGFDEGRSALLGLDVHVQRRCHCQLWSLHRTHTQPLSPPICTAVKQTRTPYTFLQLLITSSRFVSPPVCTAVKQTRTPYTFLQLLVTSSRFVSPPVCTAVKQTRIPYTFLQLRISSSGLVNLAFT